MSIFKSEKCPICNLPTNAFEKSGTKYDNKYICLTCMKKILKHSHYPIKLKEMTLEELQTIVSGNQSKIHEFNITKIIRNYIYLDENNKKIGICKKSRGSREYDIFNYSDILSFEILEDNDTVLQGGLGKSIIGGAVFGVPGAIVGATSKKTKAVCNKLQIVIRINNIDSPVRYIDLISLSNTRKDSVTFMMARKTAQEIFSVLEVIRQTKNVQNKGIQEKSIAAEIKEYKELLDIGAITEEEYRQKKKQLLGL